VSSSFADLNLTITLSGPLRLGHVVSDLYQVSSITAQQRFFVINHANRSGKSIRDYFSLDTVNGHLTLVNYVPSGVNKLSQQFSLVQQELVNSHAITFRLVRTVSICLFITNPGTDHLPAKVDRLDTFQAVASVYLPLDGQKINVDVPVRHPGLLRLFRINSNSSNIYSSVQTQSTGLFVQHSDWLLLNTRLAQNGLLRHSFDLVSRDTLTDTLQRVSFNVNLVEFSEEFDYLFSINGGENPVLDLSQYFVNSFRWIVLNDTRNLEYDAGTGLIRLVKGLGSGVRVVELKLFAPDGDIRMGRVRLQMGQVESQVERVSLHVSKRVAVGSSVYRRFGEESKIEKLMVPEGVVGAFGIDERGMRVLVGESGLQRLEMAECELRLEMSDGTVVFVRVMLLENLLRSVDFGRRNYYFSR